MAEHRENNVKRALARLTVFDVWELAPHSEQDVPRSDGEYLSPFKVSRNKTPSFSITKGGKRWKDFSTDDKAAGVYAFVELARPDWGTVERNRWLVERAGLIWETGERKVWTDEDKRAWKRKKREERDAALQAAWKAREEQYAFPARLAAAPTMPLFVAERWDEGNARLKPRDAARLARMRGWPCEWAQALIDADLVGSPCMPGCWEGQDFRSLAFLVEQPNADYSGLDAVGYHQTFTFEESGKKGFFYVPNSKTRKRPSPFQERLIRYTKQLGREVGDVLVPALPVVLGFPCEASGVVILEGQWDAFTFWGVLGGFEDGFDLPLMVFGLRGASGIDAFLGAWGEWLLEHRPRVLLMPDNDVAGRKWINPTYGKGLPNVTFRERLEHAGLQVSFSQVSDRFGKDFNDYYKAVCPPKDSLIRWLTDLKLI